MEESKDKRKWRRGDQKSKLHCKLPQQCSRVVRVTKAIVSSPVNEEEGEEEEDKGWRRRARMMRKRRRRRRRRGRRKRGSKLQWKLPQQYSRVVLVTKAIVSSPVKKEEEKETEEEEEEKVEKKENKHQKGEKDEIRTTMQSSIAMPQSCIHGPKQFQ